MIETEKKEERVLLIGVELQGMDNFDLSMEELASLAKTAGAVVVDSYRQNGKSMTPRLSSVLVSWKRLREWWMQKKLPLSLSTTV
ncbi:conserved domain protein [Streptococcus oralis SK313]|uniref:Conserved domain protein n=1 Tax=Streptococcus oralis SK313 TaxID=1035190 RepID=F9Q4D7_STROR|nr:conserved domain protein [Streptococcus oralis SK313]